MPDGDDATPAIQAAIDEAHRGSGVFCDQQIGEAEYRRFQVINDDHPELTTALNEMGHANWTVCPLCHVDDFVHVEGCRLLTAR
jgi:hypothetical protein